MSLRLDTEIRDLKERFGLSLTDLTSDELEMFVLACKRVESPFSSVNADLIERPIRICDGVYCWPLTAGALIWLEEFAKRWWPRGMMLKWAQVHAMIHARESDAFAGLTDKRKARVAIIRSALRLACHRRELQDALNRSYGASEDLAPKQPSAHERVMAQTDYASVVARLEVTSGIPQKEWLWDRAFVQTMRSYTELHALASAMSGGKRSSMHDELDDAVNDLARVKMAILRNHSKEK